jgi:hypothetical protein
MFSVVDRMIKEDIITPMAIDWTMFKDPVTTMCAIVGAGLGVFNLLQGMRERRVRLKVIPRVFFYT